MQMDKNQIIEDKLLNIIDFMDNQLPKVVHLNMEQSVDEARLSSLDCIKNMLALVEDYSNELEYPIIQQFKISRLHLDITSRVTKLADRIYGPDSLNLEGEELKEHEANEILFYVLVAFQVSFENKLKLADRNLIDAHFNSVKTKPTNETKLALSQNEIMYLFIKLGAKNLFTKSDKIHLARGIETLTGFSHNKTREKGATLTLSELENIKTILESISESLALEIQKK
jgi:hypothetical protein